MTLFVIAATSFGLVALAWVLYPAAMWLRSFTPRAAQTPNGQAGERVTVIVATRDDPSFALARARNLRLSEYPAALLRVLIAVDANSTHDLEAYRDFARGHGGGGERATLLAGKQPR
jgi:hypothetical protein